MEPRSQMIVVFFDLAKGGLEMEHEVLTSAIREENKLQGADAIGITESIESKDARGQPCIKCRGADHMKADSKEIFGKEIPHGKT